MMFAGSCTAHGALMRLVVAGFASTAVAFWIAATRADSNPWLVFAVKKE